MTDSRVLEDIDNLRVSSRISTPPVFKDIKEQEEFLETIVEDNPRGIEINLQWPGQEEARDVLGKAATTADNENTLGGSSEPGTATKERDKQAGIEENKKEKDKEEKKYGKQEYKAVHKDMQEDMQEDVQEDVQEDI